MDRFEAVLKGIATDYDAMLKRGDAIDGQILLRLFAPFQAKAAKYKRNGLVYFPAPGLRRHNEEIRDGEAAGPSRRYDGICSPGSFVSFQIYEGKDEAALPPEENGYASIALSSGREMRGSIDIEGEGGLLKITIMFYPALKVPNTKGKEIPWVKRFPGDSWLINKSSYGTLGYDVGEGMVAFDSKRGRRDLINNRDVFEGGIGSEQNSVFDSVYDMKFRPHVLKKGLLSDFLRHMQYDGFERLVG